MIYFDSSALYKLVIDEPETPALRRYLGAHSGQPRVASTLVRIEVIRAVARANPHAILSATRAVARTVGIPVSIEILEAAAALQPPLLRSLDAIHLASGLTFRSSLSAFVCYDVRLSEAAKAVGLPAVSPA